MSSSSEGQLFTGAPSASISASEAVRVLASARNPDLNDEELRQLLEIALGLYAVRLGDDAADPFPGMTAVTATDVMVVTTALLDSVNIQLFELGMWQTFSGVRFRA